MSPTPDQLYAISVTERVCSVVSLLGTGIVVVSFLYSSAFRKPINRLVFYACWGNVMANIATVVSQSGIRAGLSSPLCQFQGFLIQWFMPADALWTLAMACNVYLTFFRKYNSDQLRKQEWKYLLFCYGLPFIPAFVYFFVRSRSRGRVYGSAVLWCWISPSWDYLRLAVFYGPVWFVIFLTLGIYARTGRVIYRKRRELEQLGTIESNIDIENISIENVDLEIPLAQTVSKVTHVHITSEMSNGCEASGSNRDSSLPMTTPTNIRPPYDPYSITIEGGARIERNGSLGYEPARYDEQEWLAQRRASGPDASQAAWVYTKYAMLFFIALIITWVPSTINRVYALAFPDAFNFPLNYIASFVLPLQGFWNSIIYVSISWPAFKATFQDWRSGRKQRHAHSWYNAGNPVVFKRPCYANGARQQFRSF
ncbi:cAMP receptor-like protein [Aspergillus terreus]|uniref:cAMP receptor-like protein n=1 Tax=Aspergillus terreus TaxID=33178 RepID=A0A5M3ZEG0_ASPTE|nr:hypothetical protein ATETN484_0013004300 [Aspergillus terreus]GFF20277.1 cAMP receptor-like protein [Aspergillus terreus]